MVALQLQVDLAEEIRNITKEMRFKSPRGEQVPLNVYEQNVPMRKVNKSIMDTSEEMDEDEDDTEWDKDAFPYCKIRLDSGTLQDAMSENQIKMVLIIGIYDDCLQAHGHKNILNIFEKIIARFRKNPVLNAIYVMEDEMEWALPDEDEETFPYFFGAIYLKWKTAGVRREDMFT